MHLSNSCTPDFAKTPGSMLADRAWGMTDLEGLEGVSACTAWTQSQPSDTAVSEDVIPVFPVAQSHRERFHRL